MPVKSQLKKLIQKQKPQQKKPAKPAAPVRKAVALDLTKGDVAVLKGKEADQWFVFEGVSKTPHVHAKARDLRAGRTVGTFIIAHEKDFGKITAVSSTRAYAEMAAGYAAFNTPAKRIRLSKNPKATETLVKGIAQGVNTARPSVIAGKMVTLADILKKSTDDGARTLFDRLNQIFSNYEYRIFGAKPEDTHARLKAALNGKSKATVEFPYKPADVIIGKTPEKKRPDAAEILPLISDKILDPKVAGLIAGLRKTDEDPDIKRVKDAIKNPELYAFLAVTYKRASADTLALELQIPRNKAAGLINDANYHVMRKTPDLGPRADIPTVKRLLEKAQDQDLRNRISRAAFYLNQRHFEAYIGAFSYDPQMTSFAPLDDITAMRKTATEFMDAKEMAQTAASADRPKTSSANGKFPLIVRRPLAPLQAGQIGVPGNMHSLAWSTYLLLDYLAHPNRIGKAIPRPEIGKDLYPGLSDKRVTGQVTKDQGLIRSVLESLYGDPAQRLVRSEYSVGVTLSSRLAITFEPEAAPDFTITPKVKPMPKPPTPKVEHNFGHFTLRMTGAPGYGLLMKGDQTAVVSPQASKCLLYILGTNQRDKWVPHHELADQCGIEGSTDSIDVVTATVAAALSRVMGNDVHKVFGVDDDGNVWLSQHLAPRRLASLETRKAEEALLPDDAATRDTFNHAANVLPETNLPIVTRLFLAATPQKPCDVMQEFNLSRGELDEKISASREDMTRDTAPADIVARVSGWSLPAL